MRFHIMVLTAVLAQMGTSTPLPNPIEPVNLPAVQVTAPKDGSGGGGSFGGFGFGSSGGAPAGPGGGFGGGGGTGGKKPSVKPPFNPDITRVVWRKTVVQGVVIWVLETIQGIIVQNWPTIKATAVDAFNNGADAVKWGKDALDKALNDMNNPGPNPPAKPPAPQQPPAPAPKPPAKPPTPIVNGKKGKQLVE